MKGKRKSPRPRLPRTITHYPKRSEVARIRRKHPDTILEDDVGRLYGAQASTPVKEALENAGEIDGEHRLLWWMHLPRRRIDPRASSDRPPDPDDAMEFPRDGDVVRSFHPYLQPEKDLGSFRIVSFPERIAKNGRSASVVVDVDR